MRFIKDRNLVVKIIVLFSVVLVFTNGIGGFFYYHYAYRDLLNNNYESSKETCNQINVYLTEYLKSTLRNIYAMPNDRNLYNALNRGLFEPSLQDYLNLQQIMIDSISEIKFGNYFISSITMITQGGIFDNLAIKRKSNFTFEKDIYDYFTANPGTSIAWFPAMENPVYESAEIVIPIVYRITIDLKPLYVIVCLKMSEFSANLAELYASVDQIFIFDRGGLPVINYPEYYDDMMVKIKPLDAENNIPKCVEFAYQGKGYLVSYVTIPISQWTVCTIKTTDVLRKNINSLRVFILVSLAASIVSGLLLSFLFARTITRPLAQLASIMNRAPDTGFNVEFNWPYRDEIGTLSRSFNVMAKKTDQLVNALNENIEALKKEKENIRREQQLKRKAELTALQTQINPHFLYNTLNTISWYASDRGIDEIAVLANSLGHFFRISLSRGREVISIDEEIKHILSYLAIQSIRYKSKLEYFIDVPEDLKKYETIKLILQPLVENAIYHGIKNKEGPGHIYIRARAEQREKSADIIFEIADDGTGMSPEELKKINGNLRRGIIRTGSGYGIYNVNERLRLFYGKSYGLILRKTEEGIAAIVTIPRREFKNEEEKDDEDE
ncbi:MAG: sensor histidine kinase [Spirochaetaceae bacterium]|jgi:two-component system sensor histidine kinase YesM|nr:sensor histidine kinase [Spirochaetaceae bacterium]